MPIGLTYIIGEKEDVKLYDFAMRCARSFGALIDMKEEPMDAPIPERFEPRPFYKKNMDEAQREYDEFVSLSHEEQVALLEREYIRMVEREKETEKRKNEKRRVVRERYEKMLQKILKWKSPTPDHDNLRNFMIKQVQDSIDWDCRAYKSNIGSKEEWCDIGRHIEYLRKQVEVCRERYEEEIAACDSKNKWLADLRESLKGCD